MTHEPSPSREPRISQVLETCVYAADLEAAEAFYGGVLGLEKIGSVEGRHVFFRSGPGVFLVFNPERTLAGGELPPHGAEGPAHACFAIADADLAAWRERLAAHGVAVEAEMEWPRGGSSLYFRDPAGNSIELAPAGIWGQ
jgi:catechol 2,3-dioxygenase-like lactoylglutathione lyase family enzyme